MTELGYFDDRTTLEHQVKPLQVVACLCKYYALNLVYLLETSFVKILYIFDKIGRKLGKKLNIPPVLNWMTRAVEVS